MTFPTKEDEIVLSGFKLLTYHPMAKSQAAILKTSWKATSVQRPVIVCRMFPPYTTKLHSRGWGHGRCIFCVKRSHLSSSSFLCGSYPSEKWLRKFNKSVSFLGTYDARIGHNKADVILPLYAVYTHRQIFKKSFDRVWL